MPSISTTTLDVLEARMVPIIEATVPVVLYQSDKLWKHYKKARTAPSRTRMFTIRWVSGGVVAGGYHTNRAFDAAKLLSVVTDYAGRHEDLTAEVDTDWHQIRDRLSTLASDITSGLIQIQTTRTGPTRVADTAHARTRGSAVGQTNSNTFQVNLTYDVQVHMAAHRG